MSPCHPGVSYTSFSPLPVIDGRLFSVTLLCRRRQLPVKKYGALCCPDFPLAPYEETSDGPSGHALMFLYHSRVAAEYAALGVADEIEDCVAFLALWHLLLDQGYGLGDGATAVVEQAVDLLNELDGL